MGEVNPKEVIQAILNDAVKLTKDLSKLRSICEDSGIQVDDSCTVIYIKDDALAALEKLFKNLSGLPVVKIAAKMAAKKSGLNL